MRFYFRKEGIVFYGISFALFIVSLFLSLILSSLFLLLTLFFLYFFRDPERKIPEEGIVSPADGKIIDLTEKNDEKFIAIFMSPFNVHINRSPISGEIINIKYKKGEKFPAHNDKASILNESNDVLIKNEKISIKLRQIAGILARRIVFFKKEGDFVQKGERIGLIKFGSRVEIFLPSDVKLLVRKGDKIYAGTTIIAKEKET